MKIDPTTKIIGFDGNAVLREIHHPDKTVTYEPHTFGSITFDLGMSAASDLDAGQRGMLFNIALKAGKEGKQDFSPEEAVLILDRLDKQGTPPVFYGRMRELLTDGSPDRPLSRVWSITEKNMNGSVCLTHVMGGDSLWRALEGGVSDSTVLSEPDPMGTVSMMIDGLHALISSVDNTFFATRAEAESHKDD